MDQNRSENNSKNLNYSDWLTAVAIVAILFFLYRFFQSAGWLNGINIQSSKMTFGVSFLVGLVASVSSCLAVVGGVVIAFAEKYRGGKKSFFESSVRPNLFFHIGRLLTFFLLGGLLGLIGGKINISGNFVSIYTMIIAVVMGWLGLNILGILPPISAIGIQLPKFFRKFWYGLEESSHGSAPFLLGGLTFFLPCGFTQSMQILALASGSFWVGAFGLFFFALGTTPVLLALGVGASWGKFKKMDVFQKAAGILILIFAIFSLKSAMALRNVKTSVISTSSNTEQVPVKNNPTANSGPKEQVVEMSVTSQGFEPSVLKIKKDAPVRWVIRGVSVSGCTNKIIIPSLNISKNINSGENSISFTPTDTKEIAFSCGMGMVRGKFIVQ